MTGDQSSPSQLSLLTQVLTGSDGHSLSREGGALQIQRPPGDVTVVSETESRRLAAFVHADMVGYSSLIGQDDSGTYLRFVNLRRALIDPVLARYGGKVDNIAGDSLLMEFTSVLSAVRFAVEVQTRIPDFDDDYSPDRRIRFRMGINVGDAIEDGSNMHGDSINVAARLQSVCPPGNICVSAVVRDHLQDRLGLRFEPLGMLDLKNIARPIEAFVVRLDGHRTRARKLSVRRAWIAIPVACAGLVVAGTIAISDLPRYRPPVLAPRTASILVLPFRNVSDDAGQQYFADAVSSDVTTDLSRMRDIVVISPATAFTYKGKSIDFEQLNRDIGVRYLVAGSITRIGQTVKTNIQLIDATSGVQLWGERFENDFADLAQLEQRVTGRIAASLNVQLVHAEGRRAEQAVVPDALDLRLRATSLFLQSIAPDNTKTARDLLTQSVGLDPSSAEAWALLAQITANDYLLHWNGTGREQLREGEEAARRALSINPNLALAHFSSGLILRARGEHYLALEAFARAIDLDPNFALAHANEAGELTLIGRPSEAQPLVEKAIMLSPHDPSIGVFYWFIGQADFYAGRYDQAIPWLRKSVEARPNLFFNRLYLASAYALQDETDSAKATLDEFNRRFTQPAYTLATVIAIEQTNPVNNPIAVAARAKYHEGLIRAGMAEK
jgi:adenylate cyclase